jgi:pimeloyl-ACP methyl ester carboxylesterase
MASSAPAPAPESIEAPGFLLIATEASRALFELSSLPFAAPLLASAPRGDGHPVLVIPGFTASDRSTGILRRYLARLGYDARTWDLGRNLGPRSIGADGEHLGARLREIHERTGRKISLVGWSLGGVMARQLSRIAPDAVRQIITLGSPFGGNPNATNVLPMYERMTGHRIRDAKTQRDLAESRTAPPVPSTAIYTRGDGIVAWQNCVEPECATTDNIEVHGSHCGLGVNPAVLYAIADRLAQDEGDWKPFDRTLLRSAIYPSSGHAH